MPFQPPRDYGRMLYGSRPFFPTNNAPDFLLPRSLSADVRGVIAAITGVRSKMISSDFVLFNRSIYL